MELKKKDSSKSLLGIVILVIAASTAAICLIIPSASATINITPMNTGETYINWSWNAGLNLSVILIDGIEICGYETTNSSLLVGGLSANSLHTIQVRTDTDIGTNSTMTLPSSVPTSTPTPVPTWQPEINPSTDVKWDNTFWGLLKYYGVTK
jgi:hypothetical protein